MIHIGKRIKEVFEAQPRHFTVVRFARAIHCERANIYRIFGKENIDVNLLMRICIALNHDFFRELSEDLALKSDAGADPASVNASESASDT